MSIRNCLKSPNKPQMMFSYEPDGEFAVSREYANERRLREMGFIG
jgi:hypothetical protein